MAKQANPEEQVRAVALRLLARREHSRLELQLKLRQRQFPRGLIDTVLDEYEERGWLNDQRFGDIYARSRMDMGYGPLRIMAELQQRGVRRPPECLAQVSEAEWCRRAVALRERRFGLSDLRTDPKEKLRQARFLLRRGFSPDQVEQALARVAENDSAPG